MNSVDGDTSWCVHPVNSYDRVLASSYADAFGLPLTDSRDASRHSLVLEVTQGRLSLRDTRTGQILIDDTPPRRYRIHRRDPLGRAVGPGMRKPRDTGAVVIDATAGLGTDTIALATMGYSVIALENHPLVAALLSARLRQLDAKVAALIQPEFIDACAFLDALMAEDRAVSPATGAIIDPRVIYLDPMYPPKRRSSALPSLELQTLRRIVGDRCDRGGLFDRAYAVASRRVVVKRPHYAPPLSSDPDGCHESKLVRYDVYAKSSSQPLMNEATV